MPKLTRRVFAAALLALAGSACGAFDSVSQTQIDGGQTFLLGGEQTRPLRVEGRNIGPVAVEILKQAGGVRTSVATVAPGESFGQVFAAGETVMLRNTSATVRALVRVQFNRDVSQLSMRYIASP